MRFMMLMYPGAGPETGAIPDQKTIAAMMSYNEELTKAGVLLALEGLRPTSQGARLHFKARKATVTDGPFTEAKEIVGGYWLIDVRSRDEALEWASRCPAGDHEMIELRQVYELSDFEIDPGSELAGQVDRVSAAVSADAPAE